MALISFAVTAKLICVFVFAYAKSRFSHDEAQIYSCIYDVKININMCLHFVFIQNLFVRGRGWSDVIGGLSLQASTL